MLVINSLTDLKKYLEVRCQMAENQKVLLTSNSFECGMIYAYGESIKAVDVLIHLEHQRLNPEVDITKEVTESEIISETLERR